MYDRFVEARAAKHLVTTRTLQQWAMAAAFQFISPEFSFMASKHWVTRFKKEHRIRHRHVTKYVSNSDRDSFENTSKAAKLFQEQTSDIIKKYDPDFVINTDQTGCEYRINIHRTLSHKGEKSTEVQIKDINKATHSYTAQYSVTASGKLLPKVFICLQEKNGTFGPKVLKEVQRLSTKFNNIYVAATKSGKLQKDTYELFLDHIIHPYVNNNKFLMIVDSWGGQTSPAIYDQKFIDENNLSTCTLKIIPPKCTPLCQPCDVYFYRQIKNYIARFQNYYELFTTGRDITTRSDCIKIHALVHQQLQAPIY